MFLCCPNLGIGDDGHIPTKLDGPLGILEVD